LLEDVEDFSIDNSHVYLDLELVLYIQRNKLSNEYRNSNSSTRFRDISFD